MSNKKLSVSVIIPAYNEENRITECLEAICNQSIKPLEILLIDNNSNDQTVVIANKFSDITIIRERDQGLSYARSTGFNSAKGDIIARIDADTVVPYDWLEKLQLQFMQYNDLDGVTGYGYSNIGRYSDILSRAWSWFYFTHCKAFFGCTVLWGANMAIRSSVWSQVKDLCVYDDSLIHEDIDLSLALNSIGAHLKVVPDMIACVDFSGMMYFEKFWAYNVKKHNNRQIHSHHFRSRLATNIYYPRYHRLLFHVLSTYTIALHMLFAVCNSMVRSMTTFYYQRIRISFTDIE